MISAGLPGVIVKYNVAVFWIRQVSLVYMAGASIDELVKEREGAPLSFPHSSGLFFNFFPSFFEATLITLIFQKYGDERGTVKQGLLRCGLAITKCGNSKGGAVCCFKFSYLKDGNLQECLSKMSLVNR
jgi:hypothetical protein